MARNIITLLVTYALFALALRADETLFVQKCPNGDKLQITLSSPHSNGRHPATEPNAPSMETGKSQTWRAEVVSSDGKSSKILAESENMYMGDLILPGIITDEPNRIFAAKPVGDGVLVIETVSGEVLGLLYSKAYSSADGKTLLAAEAWEHSRNNETKCQAVIDGDVATNDLTVHLTLPDKTTKTFRWVFKDKTYHLEEVTGKSSSAPSQPTTKP